MFIVVQLVPQKDSFIPITEFCLRSKGEYNYILTLHTINQM